MVNGAHLFLISDTVPYISRCRSENSNTARPFPDSGKSNGQAPFSEYCISQVLRDNSPHRIHIENGGDPPRRLYLLMRIF